jgi:diadenosine tetraphosphatase ApaH/serine/threonine PP2A family protein phosphatase
MRVAILADLRGNLAALRAVLGHLAGRGIDRIWCLGSLLSYGPDPTAVVDTLRGRPEVRCLVGHPDGSILHPVRLGGFNTGARLAFSWAHRQLRPRPWSRWSGRWRWLASLPTADAADGLQFFSGTPLEPDGGFLPTAPPSSEDGLRPHLDLVRQGAFVGALGRQGIVFAEDAVWRDIVPGVPMPIVGRRFIACPGSVGQPRDDDPRAGYAVHDGASLTWHRVAYDVEETVRRIAAIPELPETFGLRLQAGR